MEFSDTPSRFLENNENSEPIPMYSVNYDPPPQILALVPVGVTLLMIFFKYVIKADYFNGDGKTSGKVKFS